MTSPNYGLLQLGGNAFQNALAQGYQIGTDARQRREETERKNALADYASNPTREGVASVARYDPNFALGENNRYQQQDAAQARQQQSDLGTMRQLLEHAGNNPAQAYQAAQSMGLDLSGVPQPGSPEFEPWRQQQLFIMRAMETPEGQSMLTNAAKEAMLRLPPEQRDVNNPAFIAEMNRVFTAEASKTIAYQPGGNVINYNPVTGQTQQLVQGSAMPQAPANVPPPPPGFQLEGGSGGNAAGGFPGS